MTTLLGWLFIINNVVFPAKYIFSNHLNPASIYDFAPNQHPRNGVCLHNIVVMHWHYGRSEISWQDGFHSTGQPCTESWIFLCQGKLPQRLVLGFHGLVAATPKRTEHTEFRNWKLWHPPCISHFSTFFISRLYMITIYITYTSRASGTRIPWSSRPINTSACCWAARICFGGRLVGEFRSRYHPRKSMKTWLACREQTGVPGIPSKAAPETLGEWGWVVTEFTCIPASKTPRTWWYRAAQDGCRVGKNMHGKCWNLPCYVQVAKKKTKIEHIINCQDSIVFYVFCLHRFLLAFATSWTGTPQTFSAPKVWLWRLQYNQPSNWLGLESPMTWRRKRRQWWSFGQKAWKKALVLCGLTSPSNSVLMHVNAKTELQSNIFQKVLIFMNPAQQKRPMRLQTPSVCSLWSRWRSTKCLPWRCKSTPHRWHLPLQAAMDLSETPLLFLRWSTNLAN